MTERTAETGRFGEFLGRVGRLLDSTLEAGPSDAYRERDRWESLAGSLPSEGIGADGVIAELEELVIPFGNRMSDPGFWGWVTVGPTTIPMVAAAAAHVAAPQRYGLHAFNLLEEQSLDWLAELCGLAGMKGVYSSGGSVANLLALGAARQSALTKLGIDPAADGVDGRSVSIYASAEVHHTVTRAAGVLGLGRRAMRTVPVDDRQRMRPDGLTEMLEDDISAGVVPIAVVATAGTTNTGAIDPLAAVGRIARERGVWFHVDGAYGLVGSLDERVADRFEGLELADSAIVDPHKWLGAPVGVAATFVRDRGVLYDAFTQEPADYLEGSFVTDGEIEATFDSMGVPYSEFGVELSSPSRGVMVWAILRELGVEGIRHRVVTDNDFAKHVTERARQHPDLEPLIEPELSIACFRYTDAGISDLDLVNRELVSEIRRRSPFTVSSTVVDGKFAIRPCFINSRTTLAHVDAFVDQVTELGSTLTESH
ncbi:MAG: pyridoxal-dependent decarboxylase [Acidimicrobiia bacterium]|jgi:aromatic-L-amino-acid decarboxylase